MINTERTTLRRSGRFRKVVFTTIATAAVLVLTACAGGTGGGTDGGDGGMGEAPSTISGTPLDGKVIGFVSGGPAEYYVTSMAGAKEAIEQLGGTVIEYDSAFDPTKELSNVQAAITQQVDGIVIIPLSTAGTESSLTLLNEANIPVVLLYGWSVDGAFVDKAAGFVQVDFTEYGRLIGEGFQELIPDGPVAIIQGQQGRDEIAAASAGFRAGYGNDAAIVEEIPANWDRQLAFETTNTIMTAHPDLKGLYVMNDDMAIGAINALGDKVSDVVIGSMNGSPEGLENQKLGLIDVMAQNSVPVEASMAVRILAYAMQGYTSVWSTKPCSPPLRLVVDPNASDNFTWVITPELITQGLNTACEEY